MTPCLVSLGEDTTFLVTDTLWLNLAEITDISLYAGENKDEVHIKTSIQLEQDEFHKWYGFRAEVLRQFLQSKASEDSWRS